jgi:metal-responsive CopG/Arc/MetJ family transcriptional regulator
MSKMIAIRLDEALLDALERQRKRAGLTRARAIREAVRSWIEHNEYEESIRREHEAYDRMPVTEDEFGPLLGKQRLWPAK